MQKGQGPIKAPPKIAPKGDLSGQGGEKEKGEKGFLG
jgi:hypothetical protein